MVSIYSPPDASILAKSSRALWSCRYQGNTALAVIDVHNIQAVVAMIPHPTHAPIELHGACFVVEKLGLDVLALIGGVQEDNDEEAHETD